MSGLEMMARGGRLIYVRPTGRIDERDEAMDKRETKTEDELLLETLANLPDRCGYERSTPGYWCSRTKGHTGPCAAHPVPSNKDPVPEADQPFEGGCLPAVLIAVATFLIALALFWWWMFKG